MALRVAFIGTGRKPEKASGMGYAMKGANSIRSAWTCWTHRPRNACWLPSPEAVLSRTFRPFSTISAVSDLCRKQPLRLLLCAPYK